MPMVLASNAVHGLLAKSLPVARLTQQELAKHLGVSRRTVSRWIAGDAKPWGDQIEAVVRLVAPHDAALAGALAHEAGTTLVALGLDKEEEPPPAPARPRPALRLLADSVLYAAVDAVQQATRSLVDTSTVRTAVTAAIVRAEELGLETGELARTLAPPALVASAAKKRRSG